MEPDDPTEIAELAKQAAAGEHQAWNALVKRFNGLVWAIIRRYRLGPADAQDVSQVVWLRLLENLGSLREPGHLGGWLATTTRRECLRLIKGPYPAIPTPDDQLEAKSDPRPSPEEIISAEDQKRVVFEVIGKLGERCQQLLELTAHQLPYHMISDLLGIPVGSIGPTRGRCLNQLRQLLRAAGINPAARDS
jgi:RNA polymerase sigma factor (sigma-70 family)